MTDVERKRMMGMVQTVECLFSENIALKSVLNSHRVPMPVWQKECDKLMNDPEHSSQVHAKFQGLCDEIEKARDEYRAFDTLLQFLSKPRKPWN